MIQRKEVFMKKISSGKVREIYEVDDDKLLLVVSDRISAFDYILPAMIPNKGKVLNQISAFWFDFVKDIVPNHVISVDIKDFPEEFQTPEFEGRSMLVKKLKMLPVECIVRGYITGSGWKSYKENGTVLNFQIIYKNLKNFLNLFLLLQQKLILVTMMKIFLLNEFVK